MKFIDCSPSNSPSTDDQRDALQKGLGRAVQWANAKMLSEDLLLKACLTDQRYDVQCEEARTEWLWQMVEILDARHRFRVPILHALYELADERSAYQLCELGCRYARTGDEAFRSRLYEIVESRPFADLSSLGESELLRLDGWKALTFLARVRGDELSIRDWDWHDGCIMDEAIELLGESEVRNRLNHAEGTGVRRFRDRWNQAMRQRKDHKHSSYKDRMRSLSVNDILSEAGKAKPSFGSFRGWGMQAVDSDLEIVLTRLWESTEPSETVCLLKVFSNRALPGFDARLIELCQRTDNDVRRWAFNALEKNTDPAIREFALLRLQNGDSDAIGLLTNNFEQGDENVILNCIDLPHDPFEVHSILLDVIRMLENNEAADASRLAVIAYAMTPCGICRLSAARHLHQHHAAPDWLLAECRYDSVEDCRSLADNGKSTSDRE